MQTLEFANKINKNQKTETQVEGVNMRERKGEGLALSRNVFYLLESKNVYYVQSEHSNERYYFIKYNPDGFDYCSCPDNSMRHIRCKHLFAVEYSIRKNTLKEIEHLPKDAQRYPQVISAKSYRDDDYDF